MGKKEITKYAFIDAIATAIYIIIIASGVYLTGQGVIKVSEPNLLIPIAMLMLFVFSAALTCSLIFGRPILWYLDGRKKEALSLLFYTLGIFLALTIVALLILVSLG